MLGVRGRRFAHCLALSIGLDKSHAPAHPRGLRRLILLLAPTLELALKILLPTLARDVLPCLRSAFAGKIPALVVSLLKHGGYFRRDLDVERRAARGTHDGKRLTARGRGNLILLDLVDAAGLFIELAEILNIIRRQREDKAVLAGVDDSGGLAGDLLAADKVLDVLGDHDLHTVVLADTLGQLEHKVQCDGKLGINEYMRLVDDHHDLAAQAIPCVVIAVFYDLVVDVFQHQQHLRVRDGAVAVGDQGLEIEYRKILIGGDGGRTVPDVGVPSAGGELRHIVHQCPQNGADILIVRLLELREHRVVQIVEHRVILGTQPAQIRFARDAVVRIHPVDETVEVLHGILVAVRQYLAEKLLQKLQMRGIAAGDRGAVGFVVVQRRNDLERVEPPKLSVAHVDELTVQVFRQFCIFVFRVKNEYFAVVGGKIRQQALGGVGLAGAGFSHDHHVGVDALAVAAEKVDKNRNALTAAQLDAAHIGHMGKNPRIAGGKRVAGDAPALTGQRIVTAHLRADKRLGLVKLHIVEPEAVFLIAAAHRLLHVGDDGPLRPRRLDNGVIGPRGGNIVGRYIHVHLQQGFIVLLEGGEQIAQCFDMTLQFDPAGVHSGGRVLRAQLLQRAVDAADGLGALHWAALDHDLCPGHGHDSCQPRVAHRGGIGHHAHIMGHDMIDLHRARLNVHRLRHGPLGVIPRVDALNIALVEVQLVGVLQKHRQLLIVQALGGHLRRAQRVHRRFHLSVQLALVALEKHQIVKRLDNSGVIAQPPHIVDPVIHDLDAGLVLLLRKHSLFKGRFQFPQPVILQLKAAVIHDRPLNLDNVRGIFGADRPKDAPKPALDGIGTAVRTEKAELHRGDLHHRAKIFAAVLNEAIADAGERHDLFHRRAVGLGVLRLGQLLGGLVRGGGPPGPDGLFFLRGGSLAPEQLILPLPLSFFRLQTLLALPLRFLGLLLPGLLSPGGVRGGAALQNGVLFLLRDFFAFQQLVLFLPEQPLFPLPAPPFLRKSVRLRVRSEQAVEGHFL